MGRAVLNAKLCKALRASAYIIGKDAPLRRLVPVARRGDRSQRFVCFMNDPKSVRFAYRALKERVRALRGPQIARVKAVLA